MKKKSKKFIKKHLIPILCVLLILAIAAGVYWYFFLRKKPAQNVPNPPQTIKTGELSIHFLELGNKYTGDCIFIKIGDVDILVDGGSRESSAPVIENYLKDYVSDGTLEYVIATHADQDHIAALAGNDKTQGLFERFTLKTIIDFPMTNKKTKTYERYVSERDAAVARGAVHYTALECYNGENGATRQISLSEGVSLNFLYNYYYDHYSSDENNYSVCFYINQGAKNYLFTGDLEKEGEEKLVENNTLPKCTLYKAGHHGSKTSSTEKLLSVIQPEYVCICCCAGSPEYTTNPQNTFPTQDTLKRLLKYTDKIFVTSVATKVNLAEGDWEYSSFNGNIVARCDGENFTISGSASSNSIVESSWYQTNR